MGYGNLEFDLTTGSRGGRGAYAAGLLAALTGAEAGLAVNNTAAALILSLAALAGGSGAAVSRGELIEIGGSFRLPDVMMVSSARLIEVGTTNRTRLSDYERVADDAAVLAEGPSVQLRVEGFAEEATWAELGEPRRPSGIPFVADVGSGLLDTRVPWLPEGPPAWLKGEPGVRQTIEAGASVVIFSGDKLLGGPQAGLVVGVRELVEKMARASAGQGASRRWLHPGSPRRNTRVVRHQAAAGTIPFWRMASLGYAELEQRHRAVLEAAGIVGDVVADASLPGAGSVPGQTIPSPAIRIPGAADRHWHQLVAADPPVVARRRDDALFVDLRTVDPSDDPAIIATPGEAQLTNADHRNRRTCGPRQVDACRSSHRP